MKLSDIFDSERGNYTGTQFMAEVQNIIDEESNLFTQNPIVEEQSSIPNGDGFPLYDRLKWIKIPAVNSCFVDMSRSTQMSASKQPKVMARAYRYFTQTAVNIYDFYGAAYIDVRGDGVLALFDKGKEHTALAATVAFKTFVSNYFTEDMEQRYGISTSGHYGIDRRSVLVRRIGKRNQKSVSSKSNEVWAGRPVNYSAKLASKAGDDELWVSHQFYKQLNHEGALLSCGCGSLLGAKNNLWKKKDVSDESMFSFDLAYIMYSNYCKIHGRETCKSLIQSEAS